MKFPQFSNHTDTQLIEESVQEMSVLFKEKPKLKTIVAGGLHSMAITVDGKLFTWGCYAQG